jgi:hypothetical protein
LESGYTLELTSPFDSYFGTGYLHSYPFIDSTQEPFLSNPVTTTPKVPSGVSTNTSIPNHSDYPTGGRGVNSLDRFHIFYAPCPTLTFLVLGRLVVPFPLAELQARYAAYIYTKHGGDEEAIKASLDLNVNHFTTELEEVMEDGMIREELSKKIKEESGVGEGGWVAQEEWRKTNPLEIGEKRKALLGY